MISKMTQMQSRTRARRGRSMSLLALPLLLLAGCDGVLEVEDVDVTTPGALLDPANLTAVRALGIGDFAVAFGGAATSEGVVGLSGVTSDEFHHIGSWQWIREVDTRIIAEDNPGVTTVFRALHRARTSTEFAIQAYADNAANTAPHAEQINLNGYTHLFFAENFCSGVPFSESEAGRYTYGQPLPTDEILNRAIASFDQALTVAQSGNSAPQQYLARVGKARALMGLNRYADAAVLVADVPLTFLYVSEHSENTTRQNNGIFAVTLNRREYGLSDSEGTNGVPFRSLDDLRVPWSRGERAFDTALRAYEQMKYPTRGTPIQVASGVEASLIRAEAALNRGESAAYLTELNALRATVDFSALARRPR